MNFKNVPIIAYKWYVWHSPDRQTAVEFAVEGQWRSRVVDGPYETEAAAEKTQRSYAETSELVYIIRATAEDEQRWQAQPEKANTDARFDVPVTSVIVAEGNQPNVN